jgi:hypothetical protein
MVRWQLVAAAMATILSSGQSSVHAGILPSPSVSVSIDGVPGPTVTPVYDPNALGDGKGAWTIEGYVYETPSGPSGDGGRIDLSGYLDPDPTILFTGAVVDFGSPSNFSFSYVLPLVPTVFNPSIVSDSLSGSATDSGNDGVTLTPNAPPAGINTDGDGIPEIQVFSVSADGSNWSNVGLDQGPAEVFPNGAVSDTYGPFIEGPIPTIAGGPWTHMRADLNFKLPGFGDAFSFTGRKDLVAVPEPGSLGLLGFALIACLAGRRRV